MTTPPPVTRRRHRTVHPAAVRRAEYRAQRRLLMTFAVSCAREGGGGAVFHGLLAVEAVRIVLKYCPGRWPLGKRTAVPTLRERMAAELLIIVAAVAAMTAVTVRAVGRNASAVRHRGKVTRARVATCPGRGPNPGIFWPGSCPVFDRLSVVT